MNFSSILNKTNRICETCPKTQNMIDFLKQTTEQLGYHEDTDAQFCDYEKLKKDSSYVRQCLDMVPRMKGCMFHPGACMNHLWNFAGTCESHVLASTDFNVNIGVFNCVTFECQRVRADSDFFYVVKNALDPKNSPSGLCDRVTDLQVFDRDSFKQPDLVQDKAYLDKQYKWLHAPVDPSVKIPTEPPEESSAGPVEPSDPSPIDITCNEKDKFCQDLISKQEDIINWLKNLDNDKNKIIDCSKIQNCKKEKVDCEGECDETEELKKIDAEGHNKLNDQKEICKTFKDQALKFIDEATFRSNLDEIQKKYCKKSDITQIDPNRDLISTEQIRFKSNHFACNQQPNHTVKSEKEVDSIIADAADMINKNYKDKNQECCIVKGFRATKKPEDVNKEIEHPLMKIEAKCRAYYISQKLKKQLSSDVLNKKNFICSEATKFADNFQTQIVCDRDCKKEIADGNVTCEYENLNADQLDLQKKYKKREQESDKE